MTRIRMPFGIEIEILWRQRAIFVWRNHYLIWYR